MAMKKRVGQQQCCTATQPEHRLTFLGRHQKVLWINFTCSFDRIVLGNLTEQQFEIDTDRGKLLPDSIHFDPICAKCAKAIQEG